MIRVLYFTFRYLLIAIIALVLLIYLSRTDRFPKILPDEWKLFLIDVSDVILSPSFTRSIYTTTEAVIDFLADDGYSLKYQKLPLIIKERIESEIQNIFYLAEIFLNNSLIEAYLIESIISEKENQIINKISRETFESAYFENIYILSSQGVELISIKDIPEITIDTLKQFSIRDQKVNITSKYILLNVPLRKKINFIDGNFFIVFNTEKFLEKVINHDLANFRAIYLSDKYGNIIFSNKILPENLQLDASEVNILGVNLRNTYVELYSNTMLGFLYDRPTFLRYVFIVFKILIFIGIILLIIFIFMKVRSILSNVTDRERKLLKQLERFKALPKSRNNKDIGNFFLETAEENLNFFENFIKTSEKNTSEYYKHKLF